MAKVTQYNMDKFHRGVNGFGLPFCTTVYSATLVANADTTVAVPLTSVMGNATATTYNKFMAIFSCDNAADVFVALNGTAAAPAGGTFAASTSELIPRNTYWAKVVKAGDVIHVKSPGTPSVTVAFYAIQE